METRQQELLNLVVEKYIETAEPVGSKFLAYKEKIGWSEATVRNDLRALEEAGYLTHPHTSAGRIPTELGYRYYVDTFDAKKIKISGKEASAIEKAFKNAGEYELSCKAAAKESSGIAREAVIIAFNLDKVYYTGFSNLFEKPEFINTDMVISTSRMFDQCEKCLGRFVGKVSADPKIFIGSEHPFGNYLSVVATQLGSSDEGMFIILGPTRMNYKRNLAIAGEVNKLL